MIKKNRQTSVLIPACSPQIIECDHPSGCICNHCKKHHVEQPESFDTAQDKSGQCICEIIDRFEIGTITKNNPNCPVHCEQPESGRSFFDMSDKEKREIVETAAKESNRMQQELIDKAGSASVTTNLVETSSKVVDKEEGMRKYFEANLLDGESIEEGGMIEVKFAWKVVEEIISQVRQDAYKQGVKSVKGTFEEVRQDARREERERIKSKVGMLRQWLNEDHIADVNKMVTNEQIEYWLDLSKEGGE